ncbi:telomerase reverse transcriptase-like [Dendronephthya gigantea]|uniref:telomerase reverse transcriptase-like n=1 Tax=Dendronephthya gigantea TaxID=151771 RepID=UPI00106ACF85|nr:telomerase reverse transcriptase-like [Dendronephthya gigantea]
MSSSIVACDATTNLRVEKFCTKKASTIDELLSVLISLSTVQGEPRDNMLTMGYKRGTYVRPVGDHPFYQNSMAVFVQSAIFEALHELIGSDLMLHLMKNLSLFIKEGSCFMQVTGKPINEVLKDVKKPSIDGKELVSRKITGVVGHDKRWCFPVDHVMEKSPCSTIGARALMKEIFTSDQTSKYLEESVEDFVLFLRRHKSCPFKKLLVNICPESKSLESVPFHQLKLFTRAVLKRAVPMKLWGCRKNLSAFDSSVERYLSLRKGENMSVHNVMNGIRVSECGFVKLPARKTGHRIPQSLSLKREDLVRKFFVWLMNCYVVPLLRNCFTITESVPTRNRLLYYRRGDWDNAQTSAVQELRKTMLLPLPQTEAEKRVASRRSLKAPLRFIPKASGVRPVMNMTAKVNPPEGYPHEERSVNEMLTFVDSVLTYECRRCPELLGGCVMDYGEIFRKLSAFKESHRSEQRPLIVVRLDFSKCYDRFDQKKMMEILKEVIKEDEYNIRKFIEMKTNLNNNIVYKHKKPAAPIEDNRSFPVFLKENISDEKMKNTVAVDKMFYNSVPRAKIIEDLWKHIRGNVVQLSSSQYFLQKCGIAQGSKIAPTLCHLYLGHMERTKVPDVFSDPDTLLMRWIDDPLLLTYDQQLAKRYLTAMLEEDPIYKCKINVEKCLVNFDAVTSTGEPIKKLSDEETSIPWCSLFINIATFDVRFDYSRCESFEDIKNSLKYDTSRKPGENMFKCLKFALQTKLHQLFLDPKINCVRTIETNVRECFTYFIRRMDAMVSELPPATQAHRNPEFFLRSMDEIFETYYQLASRFLPHDITREKVHSLFYQAVLEFIKRKTVRFLLLLFIIATVVLREESECASRGARENS